MQDAIDKIWDKYDVDKSGDLDKEETRNFVQEILRKNGSGQELDDE